MAAGSPRTLKAVTTTCSSPLGDVPLLKSAGSPLPSSESGNKILRDCSNALRSVAFLVMAYLLN